MRGHRVNFQRGRTRESPEINLIPMIDLLLVVVIFLVITTTYSKFAQLQINLPKADAAATTQQPNEINVAVTAEGNYLIDKSAVAYGSAESFSAELRRAAKGAPDPVVVISADASATHQAVIRVMEAARIAGYGRITFTTQTRTR